MHYLGVNKQEESKDKSPHVTFYLTTKDPK